MRSANQVYFQDKLNIFIVQTIFHTALSSLSQYFTTELANAQKYTL